MPFASRARGSRLLALIDQAEATRLDSLTKKHGAFFMAEHHLLMDHSS